ncbi:Fibrocystin-L [Quaeritorhiza haematococci]|nr:Fibrocystin-L [Quaeritorhiza haematococci]
MRKLFEEVMCNPQKFNEFKKFSQSTHTHENILFYEALLILEDLLSESCPSYRRPTSTSTSTSSSSSSTRSSTPTPYVLTRFLQSTHFNVHNTFSTTTSKSTPSNPFKQPNRSSSSSGGIPVIPVPPTLIRHYRYVYNFFLSPTTAPMELNISSSLRRRVSNHFKHAGAGAAAASPAAAGAAGGEDVLMSNVFDAVAFEVLNLIYFDVFARWVGVGASGMGGAAATAGMATNTNAATDAATKGGVMNSKRLPQHTSPAGGASTTTSQAVPTHITSPLDTDTHWQSPSSPASSSRGGASTPPPPPPSTVTYTRKRRKSDAGALLVSFRNRGGSMVGPHVGDGIAQVVTFPYVRNFQMDFQVFVIVGDTEADLLVPPGVSTNETTAPPTTRFSQCRRGSFSSCYFTYTQSMTPVVTSVTPSHLLSVPSEASGPTFLTIIGNFLASSIEDYSDFYFGSDAICFVKDEATGLPYEFTTVNGADSVKLLGKFSGNLIPKVHVDGYGFSAISARAVIFDGSGRPMLAQAYPVIHSVDGIIGSHLGGSTVTIRGRGFLPLLSHESSDDYSTDFSDDLPKQFFETAIQTVTDSPADSGRRTVQWVVQLERIRNSGVLSNDFNETLTTFMAAVGGSQCFPTSFAWVFDVDVASVGEASLTSGTTPNFRIWKKSAVSNLVEEVSCTTYHFDEDSNVTAGSRGSRRLVYKWKGYSIAEVIQGALDGSLEPDVDEALSDGLATALSSDLWPGDHVGEYLLLRSSYYNLVTSTTRLFLTRPSKGILRREIAAAGVDATKQFDPMTLDMKEGDSVLLELYQYTKTLPFTPSAGHQTLAVRILDPPQHISSTRGGNSSASETSTWNFNADWTSTIAPEIQKVRVSAKYDLEVQNVYLSLIPNSTQKTLDWTNADAFGWDASETPAQIVWGSATKYLVGGIPTPALDDDLAFELTANTEADEVRQIFLRRTLSSQCLWIADNQRSFYDLDTFEFGAGKDGWTATDPLKRPVISGKTANCGRYSLYFPPGSSGANVAEFSIEPSNPNMTQNNWQGHNTNQHQFMCMAYKIPADAKAFMVIDIMSFGSMVLNIKDGALSSAANSFSQIGDWNNGWTYKMDQYGNFNSRRLLPMRFDDTWNYQCIDLKAQIEAKLGPRPPGIIDPNTGEVDRVGGYYIPQVRIRSDPDSSAGFYIDDFIITQRALPLVRTRSGAVTTTGNATVQDVTVSKQVVNATHVLFSFTLTPENCGTNLSMMTAYFDPELKTRFKGTPRPPLNKNVDSLDQIASATGATLTVFTKRVSAASARLEGVYSLQISDKKPVEFHVRDTADVIQRKLCESIAPYALASPVIVSRAGESTCSSFSFNFEFRGLAGDVPAISVNVSRITGGVKNLKATVETTRQGAITLFPIPADLLSLSVPATAASVQDCDTQTVGVSLWANGVAASCSYFGGQDSAQFWKGCTYEAVVGGDGPMLLSLNPLQGKPGDTLTIKATRHMEWTPINPIGLNTRSLALMSTPSVQYVTPADVFLGDPLKPIPCTLTLRDAETLVCTLGEGGVGGESWPLWLHVPGFGYALRGPEMNMFSFALEVYASTPSEGSLAGSTHLKISGVGFSDQKERMTVHFKTTIDGRPYDFPLVVISSTNTLIECIAPRTPPFTALSEVSYDVVVGVLDDKLSKNIASAKLAKGFKQTLDATPVIEYISPNYGSAAGLELVTLRGRRLLPDENGFLEVWIGQVPCAVQNATADTIYCITSPHKQGRTRNITVFAGERGYAWVYDSVEYSYEFTLDEVAPDGGSLYGGQLIKVHGSGFCPLTDTTTCLDGGKTNVSIGEAPCDIVSMTFSSIECRTPPAARTHTVTNNGTHPLFGAGFKFDPANITIDAGDYVEWRWTGLDDALDGVTHHIMQVMNNTDTSNMLLESGSGFASLETAGTGTFKIRFYHPGKYYYMSGVYPSRGFRGVVYVVSRQRSFNEQVRVFSGDLEATLPGGICGETSSTAFGYPTKSTFWLPTQTMKTVTSAWDLNSESMTSMSTMAESTTMPMFSSSVVYEDILPDEAQRPESTTLFKLNVRELKEDISGPFEGVDSPTKPPMPFEPSPTDIFFEAPETAILFQPPESVAIEFKDAMADTWTTGYSFEYTSTAESWAEETSSLFSYPIQSSEGDTMQPTTTSGYFAFPTGSATTSSFAATSTSCALGGMFYRYRVSLAPEIREVHSGVFEENVMIIRGVGLGTSLVHTTVSFGAHACTVLSTDGENVACSISETMIAGAYPVEVFTSYGKSLPFVYVKRAHIVSMSGSNVGSAEGGTRIVLHGTGFPSDSVSVYVGTAPCRIVTANSTTIECDTPPAQSATSQSVSKRTTDGQPLSVTVNVWGGNYAAGLALPLTTDVLDYYRLRQQLTCDSCTFQYSVDQTPQVTDIRPRSAAEGSVITIDGQMLSDLSGDTVVHLGDVACKVFESSPTQLKCIVGAGPLGLKQVVVITPTLGKASLSNANFWKTIEVLSVSPNRGSVLGGTMLSIVTTNNPVYRSMNSITITINDSPCTITFAGKTLLTCVTTASKDTVTEFRFPLVYVSGTEAALGDCTLEKCGFMYDAGSTPSLVSVNPTNGKVDDLIIFQGTHLGTITQDVTISMGGQTCPVEQVSDTSVTCRVPALEAAYYTPSLLVSGKGIGMVQNITFRSNLAITSLAGTLTSGLGGGVQLIFWGRGFGANTTVTICDHLCSNSIYSYEFFKCWAPAYQPGLKTVIDTTQKCPILVTQNGISLKSTIDFTYQGSLTPVVTSFSPTTGGTGGGTLVFIRGTGLKSKTHINETSSVTIGGVPCEIILNNSTLIECRTGQSKQTGVFNMIVNIAGVGDALFSDSDAFFYIDRWSSQFTWGGSDPPVEGDSVHIPANHTVLLDTNSARLVLLFVEGTLLFDKTKDITLQAKYIFIHNGGKLQIGAPDEPYQNQARIRLLGNIRDRILPIYGSKVIGVRRGTLQIFGKPTNLTWTHLRTTALSGDMIVKLDTFVDWQVGSRIVLSPTSTNPMEAEEFVINKVTADESGSVLELNAPLAYTHVAVSETIEGRNIELKAAVGLLSRNVVIEGDLADYSNDPDGAVDRFGGHVLIHPPHASSNEAVGQLSYVEFRNMGQAFQLGRYPVHFHLAGDMRHNGSTESESFVRGCSIHTTFNRALTAHGVHGLQISDNVAYDVLGHTFFVEDGIETNNTFTGNLGVLTKKSLSLLHTDRFPAVFWITNPTNHYTRNTAAGSMGSGFFYNLQPHPTGPSATTTVCPSGAAMGRFTNNVAHSCDWGLRIWESYIPVEFECYGRTVTASFNGFTGWANRRGVELNGGGGLQFNNFILTDNSDIQLVISDISASWGQALVKDALIISHVGSYLEATGITGNKNIGLNTPGTSFLSIANTTFVGFDTVSGVSILPCSFCHDKDGGWETRVSGLKFVGSNQRRIVFSHEHEAIFSDLDGCLTGKIGTIRPASAILPTDGRCNFNIQGFEGGAVPGLWCDPSVKNRRMGLNFAVPWSLTGRDLVLSNKYGSTRSPWREKRSTHSGGYMALLVADEDYDLRFDLPTNSRVDVTSFSSKWYQMDADSWFRIRIPYFGEADHLSINGIETGLESMPTITENSGTWGYNKTNKEAWIVINGKPTAGDKQISYRLLYCPINGCPPPQYIPTAPNGTVGGTFLWSNETAWPGGQLPGPEDDVYIWGIQEAILDINVGIRNLFILGTVRFDRKNLHLSAQNIFVMGGQLLIGNQTHPFQEEAKITIYGNRTSDMTALTDRVNLGGKSLAVFGKLEVVGKPLLRPWTTLKTTAEAGSTVLVLNEPVDWPVDGQIAITSTEYEPMQSEVADILGISDDGYTITLYRPLQWTHFSGSVDVGEGKSMSMNAEVALLSRNIIIEGGEDDSGALEKQNYGARIYVSGFTDYNTTSPLFGTHNGLAHLQNVEIRFAGQRGFTDLSDYRAAVVFDYGDVGINRTQRSVVANCSIHHSYHSSIAIIGINGKGDFGSPPGDMPVDVLHNVAYLGYESTFKFYADGITVIGNLGFGTQISFPRPQDVFSTQFIGTFEHTGVDSTILNNVAAGSQSMGFIVMGSRCRNDGQPHKVAYNRAHSNIYGAHVTGISVFHTDCTSFSHFDTWKNWNIGVFFHGITSARFSQIFVADSRSGFLGICTGPEPQFHYASDKYIQISDSVFVGSSGNEKCLKSYAAPSVTPPFTFGSDIPKAGIMYSMFQGSSVDSIKFLLHGKLVAWPTLKGHVSVKDSVFANFGLNDCGEKSFAITNYWHDEDAPKPHYLQNVRTFNVDQNYKVYFFPPRTEWISDILCGDMDCDGPKHSLLMDMDGTFLGTGTGLHAVVPYAELRFDASKVPIIMRTRLDGSLVPVNQIAPNRGVYRNSGCTLLETWNAYHCQGTLYNMFVMENMDSDSLDRRISPAGLLSVAATEGNFLDLLNGPKTIGWCSHYSCLKRLGAQFGLVAVNRTYQVAFTGSNPSKMRFFHLNAKNSDAIIVNIYWRTSQVLSVYVSGSRIPPLDVNATRDASYNPANFAPQLTMANGANYFNRQEQIIQIVLKGSEPIIIDTSPAVEIGLGVSVGSAQEFYDNAPNLMANLIGFLGVDPKTVRVASIVPETTGGRRKRDGVSMKLAFQMVSGVKDTVETPAPPSSSSGGTTAETLAVNAFQAQLKTFQDTAGPVLALRSKSASLVQALQSGSLSLGDGVALQSIDVALPPLPVLPAVSDAVASALNISNLAELLPSDLDLSKFSSNTTGTGGSTDAPAALRIPSKLMFKSSFGNRYINTLPDLSFEMVDATAIPVTTLGVNDIVWYVKAELVPSNQTNTGNNTGNVMNVNKVKILATNSPGNGTTTGVQLVGSTLAPFVNGSARFTNLSLSDSANDVSIRFSVYAGSSEDDLKLVNTKFTYVTEAFSFTLLRPSPSGTSTPIDTFIPPVPSTSPTPTGEGGTPVGIVAGVVAGGAVAIGAAVFLVIRRRRRQRQESPKKATTAKEAFVAEAPVVQPIEKESEVAPVEDIQAPPPPAEQPAATEDDPDRSAEILFAPDVGQGSVPAAAPLGPPAELSKVPASATDITSSSVDVIQMILQNQTDFLNQFCEVHEQYIPNDIFPDEIALDVGDFVHVTDLSPDKEWLVGYSVNKNKTGRFPAKCVHVMDRRDPRIRDVARAWTRREHLMPLEAPDEEAIVEGGEISDQKPSEVQPQQEQEQHQPEPQQDDQIQVEELHDVEHQQEHDQMQVEELHEDGRQQEQDQVQLVEQLEDVHQPEPVSDQIQPEELHDVQDQHEPEQTVERAQSRALGEFAAGMKGSVSATSLELVSMEDGMFVASSARGSTTDVQVQHQEEEIPERAIASSSQDDIDVDEAGAHDIESEGQLGLDHQRSFPVLDSNSSSLRQRESIHVPGMVSDSPPDV